MLPRVSGCGRGQVSLDGLGGQDGQDGRGWKLQCSGEHDSCFSTFAVANESQSYLRYE